MMTSRERYLATLTFGTPDRVPFEPSWPPRRSTLKRWHADGLPENVDWFAELCRLIDVTIPPLRHPWIQPHCMTRMNPMFEEKVLKHENGTYIVQDWMGNITEISDEFDVTYIREAVDFVTRKWHGFPVENRADFEEMKKRYNPRDPERHAADPAAHYAALRGRDYATRVSINGPFWQLREWCGFEPLCELLIDDPDFVREMIEFWTEFVSATLAPLFAEGVVDCLQINEDMAYKEEPMISPAMTREFLKPSYDRWGAEARRGGVTLIDMDSDGRIDLLIPIWIDAGINVCDPIEVAAGCDIVEYRRQFRRKMAYRGAVDKRLIARGGKAIEDELTRIAPVIRDGGFIPGCDHAVPHDVSWQNYVHYARCLAELTGWR